MSKKEALEMVDSEEFKRWLEDNSRVNKLLSDEFASFIVDTHNMTIKEFGIPFTPSPSSVRNYLEVNHPHLLEDLTENDFTEILRQAQKQITIEGL